MREPSPAAGFQRSRHTSCVSEVTTGTPEREHASRFSSSDNHAQCGTVSRERGHLRSAFLFAEWVGGSGVCVSSSPCFRRTCSLESPCRVYSERSSHEHGMVVQEGNHDKDR